MSDETRNERYMWDEEGSVEVVSEGDGEEVNIENLEPTLKQRVADKLRQLTGSDE